MRLWTLLLMAGALSAQPAIRVSVNEGLNGPPVVGAGVLLIEFQTIDGQVTRVPYGTAYTDASGAAEFRPARLGNYFVEARKPGYWGTSPTPGPRMSDVDAAEGAITLTESQPDSTARLFLVRPGSLRGRLEDENGQPLTDRPVFVEAIGPTQPGLQLSTNNEGVFFAERLTPGNYVLRVAPGRYGVVKINEDFTEEDATRVDNNIETSYWPGGVTDRQLAVPIAVTGGAIADAGTLRPRTRPYYRVRVRVSGADCAKGIGYRLGVLPRLPATASSRDLVPTQVGYLGIACREEFLVTGLAEGQYWFALMSATTPPRWSLAAIDVRRENDTLDLALAPAVNIPMRFVAAEGASIENLSGSAILMPKVIGAARNAGMQLQIATGDTAFKDVVWPEHQVLTQIRPPHYVVEMRYGGRPVINETIAPTAGSDLEIVIDDRPASVTGSITNADEPLQVLLLRYPTPQVLNPLQPPPAAVAGPDGRFVIRNVPPGEYRAVVVTRGTAGQQDDLLGRERLAASGERVTLERGETKEITLRAR